MLKEESNFCTFKQNEIQVKTAYKWSNYFVGLLISLIISVYFRQNIYLCPDFDEYFYNPDYNPGIAYTIMEKYGSFA